MEVCADITPSYAYANRPVRRHLRTLFSVPITLHYSVPRTGQTWHGISLDISESGVGVLVRGQVQIGERVEIDFPLHGCALNTVAVVRHASSTRVGFEFLELTPAKRSQIANAGATA